MKTVILRFFSLDVINTHPAIYWGLLIVWVLILIATFSSIRTQLFGMGTRMFWLAFCLFIPIIGVACYTLWCLINADWTALKPLVQSKSAAIRAVTDSKNQR